MSPQCRMKRSTTAGSFFLSVVSVITEISDSPEPMSRRKCAARHPVLMQLPLLGLNDHAVRGGTAFAGRGTCGDQGSNGPLQCLKLGQLLAQLAEMSLRELARLAAGRAVLHQRQQCANL